MAPCLNWCLDCLMLKERRTALWAIWPKASTILRFAMAAISLCRKVLHCLISLVAGLFCGGTQRTALVIRQFLRCILSSFDRPYSPQANPRCLRVGYRRSPAKSPVNGRPVRFAPLRPGARPTTSNCALSEPKDFTGPLCQVGSASLFSNRNSANLLHCLQFFVGALNFFLWFGTVQYSVIGYLGEGCFKGF